MAYSDSTCFVNSRLRIILSKYLGSFRSSYHVSQAGAILFSNLLVCSIANAQGPEHQTTKGFQITQTEQDTTIVTVLSVEGLASKQYGADGKAIRGAIMRYRDAIAFGLDYHDRTAHSVTFKVAVANKLAENARISRIRAIPGMTSTIPNGLNAPPFHLARSVA